MTCWELMWFMLMPSISLVQFTEGLATLPETAKSNADSLIQLLLSRGDMTALTVLCTQIYELVLRS